MQRRPRHIIFWTVCFFLSYATDFVLYGMKVQYGVGYFVTLNVFLFSAFTYCLKKFSKKSYGLFIWSILRFGLVFLVFFLVRYLIRHYLKFDAARNPVDAGFDLKQFNLESLYWVISYLLLSSGYYYFVKSVEREKSLRMAEKELAEQQLLVEEAQRQKVEFEQAFFQAQINPHFLYNVLSYLYSEALQYSEKMAESIHLLSDIMRYCLQPEDNLNQKVLLTREVDYMENFIKLNQFRFDHNLQIQLCKEGSFDGALVAPMVLMTFLENIFKHGELRDPKAPARIDIRVSEETFSFLAVNKKRPTSSKQDSAGIGLEFIKKRLNYFYGNKYTLDIQDVDGYYSVHLNLPLFKNIDL